MAPRERWCWMLHDEWMWNVLTVHRRCIRWRHCGRPWPRTSTIHLEERKFINWLLRRNQMYSGNGLLQGLAGGDARQVCHQHRHSFPLPRDHNAARASTPCGFSGVACTVLFAVTVPHPRASV
ncbi:hypothetical protein BCY84_01991 [Trypanosoma cruzi cruzi]|nr:hypothetical protein BCY84_01991 [Trypanosoma cruzi cruzi]